MVAGILVVGKNVEFVLELLHIESQQIRSLMVDGAKIYGRDKMQNSIFIGQQQIPLEQCTVARPENETPGEKTYSLAHVTHNDGLYIHIIPVNSDNGRIIATYFNLLDDID
jgi:hypothetical protein